MSTLEKGLVVSDKNQTYTYPLTWKFHSQREMNVSQRDTCSQKGLYKNVHSSFIHNSLRMETSHMCLSRRMDRQIVVCSYKQ